MRFFHDASDQSKRFELYNLRDDLGETKDLATQFPDKVKELDALIDAHLRDTHSLVPEKNPAYNAVVQDWTPNKESTVTVRDGALVLTAITANPTLAIRELPHAHGPYGGVRMKSNSKGNGRIFWAANPRDHSSATAPRHSPRSTTTSGTITR